MRMTVVTAALFLATAATSPARAETPAQTAQRLRDYAQFDQARAAEFTKIANEDEGVARGREAQANDLDNNARNFEQRANFHRQVAAAYGNNPEQLRLAGEADMLARDFHNMANERRQIAKQLSQHVAQMRNWAKTFADRARNELAMANNLQNAGKL